MHTSQAPIGSGFGPATTAHDIVEHCDLSGKVAIVTGGYAGMGLAITKALISTGATVVAPRASRKALKALGSMKGAEVETLDLMGPGSVDGFVRRFWRPNDRCISW